MKIERDISAAYSGKAHTCCCGCAGKHYALRDGTKALAQIARIKRVIETAPAENVMVCGSFTSADIGTRVYIVYHDDRGKS